MLYLVRENPIPSILAFTVSLTTILILLLVITITVVFIYQLRKAIDENFVKKSRNVVLGILGSIILLFFYQVMVAGQRFYKAKKERGIVLVAIKSDNNSCLESLVLSRNGKFDYYNLCDNNSENNGNFTIKQDTIFLHDIKKYTDFYEFAIIEKSSNKIDDNLMLYKNKKDKNPFKMDISTNETAKYLSKR